MCRNAARIIAMRTAARILTCGFGWALALVASAAESPVWIVLGSYQNAGNAEAARQLPASEVLEPLQVRAFDTSAGRWHRLLLGPFEKLGEGMAMLAEARGRGHADAWLLAGHEGEAPLSDATSGTAADATLPAYADDGLEDWERFDPYGDLGEWEDLPPLPETDVHLLSEQHKTPVSEPPPGYQLHKLRRSGS